MSGCVDRPALDDGDPPDPSTSTTSAVPETGPLDGPGTSGMNESTGASTSLPTAGTDTSDDGVVDDGTIFICNVDDDEFWHCQPDGGFPIFECDPLAQDCAAGEKCMPWANDGSPGWNATRCSPFSDRPDGLGEPCTVEGNAVSGIDSCGPGLMCWHVDPSTNQGECIAMCTGNEGDLQCAEAGTHCAVHNNGALFLCLPDCDPLAPACDEDEVCLPGPLEPWSCVPGLSPPIADATPCAYANSCGPGSVCAKAEVTPGCADPIGCCAPVCDLDVGLCPDAATTCAPWYPRGAAPPGLESTGLCAADPVPPKTGWVDLDLHDLGASF
ncbi:MAG: hypothetical protein KDK70_12995 [Myxococcales bacterium]|nr:hypothetical protein [Myxococcales bacterium]